MSFNQLPQAWLGRGYTADDSAHTITLTTGDAAAQSIGTFVVDTGTDVLTVAVDHLLKTGDIVRVSSGTTLPAGLAAATNYFVKTVPSSTTLTLSATKGGTTINIEDTGTGTHTIHSMGLLTELSDAEADIATGDIRKLIFALEERLYLAYQAIPSEDRPANWSMSRGSSYDDTTGIITRTYYHQIMIEATSLEVANEA